jgi:hypothetical protein
MKREIRNKRKRLTTRPENENPQQGGKKEEWEKVMCSTLSQEKCQKMRGDVHQKNTQPRKTLLTITAHFKIDAACFHYNTTNIVCL